MPRRQTHFLLSSAIALNQREQDVESHGALVGWSHHDLADRVLLRLQSVRTAAQADQKDPDLFRFLMTKQQAAVPGNYLLEIAGQTAADPKERTWFRRMFG